jgi:hypothetical protein
MWILGIGKFLEMIKFVTKKGKLYEIKILCALGLKNYKFCNKLKICNHLGIKI